MTQFRHHGMNRGQLCMAEQVSEEFRRYYAELYASRHPHNYSATSDHLAHIAIKWLTSVERERLMVPLRPMEIVEALKAVLSGKAPVQMG
ncbi:hypothetical protein NDU88_008580 [Pleurodeles waltl]|uniref:Uncharacterized protein n=1 Tax=Pleurodeles waltl TaxID=8319 RepID=A0AAV7PSL1_PLEWA|nr:hypothetical protein NDU88_008580 [Pleurodeles waltl]